MTGTDAIRLAGSSPTSDGAVTEQSPSIIILPKDE